MNNTPKTTGMRSLSPEFQHEKEEIDALRTCWSEIRSIAGPECLAASEPQTGGSGYPILLESSSSSPTKATKATRRTSRSLMSMSTIPWSEDKPSEMTNARRIALHLMNKKWYNPRAGSKRPNKRRPNVQQPDLAKAWEFWEHVVLPRHFWDAGQHRKKQHIHWCTRFRHRFQKGSQLLERAEPGETKWPTRLYSPIFTPLAQMGDFGVGIGLYFSALRAIIIFTLIAGLLSIPSIAFYAGKEYSQNQPGVPFFLKGTAICTNEQWVPCPTCSTDQFEEDRLGTATSASSGTTMQFALRNFCEGAALRPAMVNYATMIFVLFGIVMLAIYQRRMEMQFDEDELTAKDYSIVVKNPPEDARDPLEWKLFFQQFKGVHVTCCTVALDDDFLLRSLVERREVMSKLELQLEKGANMSDLALARLAAKIQKRRSLWEWFVSYFVPGIPELLARERVLTFRIQGLAQYAYPVKNVFISFETEKAKHRVLSALTVPSNDIRKNDPRNLANPQKFLFRGTRVLHVDTPQEPTAIRWQDLNATLKTRVLQLLFTSAISVGIVALIVWLVSLVHTAEMVSGAYVIAAANAAFPAFAKVLTKFEYQVTECEKQTSLYLKIAVFRYVNTAVIIAYITPFTSTLSNREGLLYWVANIFFADLVFTTGTRLLDPIGQFRRHYLAPRAKNQDMMNIHMQGIQVEVAELYTDMTKILFLSFWYCSLYPSAFFICSMILSVKYFADRFGIMRSWKRAPQLGSQISRFSRHYFLSFAFCALAIVSAYHYSAFPFDNLCPTGTVSSDYVGNWTVSSLHASDSNTQNVTILAGDDSYQYCLQDLLRRKGQRFPPIPKHQPEGEQWMTEDQELVTKIYGWTALCVLALAIFILGFGWTGRVAKLFHKPYKTRKKDQGMPFSEVATMEAYVPQVHSSMFPHPLLACDSLGLEPWLYGWTDPDRSHLYYDLAQDVDFLCSGLGRSEHILSTLTHWRPPPQFQVYSREQGEEGSFC